MVNVRGHRPADYFEKWSKSADTNTTNRKTKIGNAIFLEIPDGWLLWPIDLLIARRQFVHATQYPVL
jgi:hypothetical protein